MSIFSFVRSGGRLQKKQQTSPRHRSAATRQSLDRACTEALESRRLMSATLVSANFPNTGPANGSSDNLFGPFVSTNGRYVAFDSQGTDLASAGTTGQQVYLRDRLTGVNTLVSVDLNNAPVAGNAWVADMTPDGRYVLFFTDADITSSNVETNRVTIDDNGQIDLYLRDTVSGNTYLISGDSSIVSFVSGTGGQLPPEFNAVGVVNDGTIPTLPAYISDDGRFVSFVTVADDVSKRDHIADGFSVGTTFGGTDEFVDNNGAPDIYVRDRQLASNILVTEGTSNNKSAPVTEAGTITSYAMSSLAGGSLAVAFATDGKYSGADTNGDFDVYRRNLDTGSTFGISTSNGLPGPLRYYGISSNVNISADGSTVAYIQDGSLAIWSTNANGAPGGSPDLRGRYATFHFIFGGGGGAAGVGATGTPVLTPDGRYVVFTSDDTDLTDQITTGTNVFRYDRGADQRTDRDPYSNGDDLLEIVSINSTGGTNTPVGNANAGRLSISDDGRWVAFQSDAANGGDPVITNFGSQTNVYVRDMNGTQISLLNVAASDPTAAAAGNAYQAMISPNGKVVAFVSDAANLVANDNNGQPDVFTADVIANPSPALHATLSSSNVTNGGATSYTFTVTYVGPRPIVISSIDDDDIIVMGPNGIVRQAQLVSVNSLTNANIVTATYRIVPPGGSWDITDNGTYTIHLNNRQVSDIQGNQILGQDLGKFQVAISSDNNVGPTFTATVLESAGTYTLRIQRSPSDAGGVTASIDYAVLSGTATYGIDFRLHDPSLLQAGTLPVTLPPGGFYDLVFDIINDSMVESNETFQVVLKNITVGATTTFQRAIITINDDDSDGSGQVGIPSATPIQPVGGVGGSTISIENGVPTVRAPETIVTPYGAGKLPITISRAGTGTTAVTTTFNYTIYSTPSDSAVGNENFVAATGTLTFAPGEETKDLVVTLLHDRLVTGDRTFTVVLTNATTGVMIGGTSIQVVVQDVDSAVQFSNTSINTNDDAGIIDVPVTRIGNLTPGSKVHLTFSGSAIAGVDYVLVGDGVVDEFGDITFAPGETSKVVHVQLLSRPFNPGTSKLLNVSLNNSRALATSDPFSYDTVLGTPSTEAITVNNVDATAPQVSSVDFKLKNGRIASVLVTFNEDIKSAGATKLSNYALFNRTRTGQLGQLIRLASAKYDPSTRTVTLTPASALALNQMYQVNVNGAGTITDIAGNRFDGDANGRAGGSFSGTFGYGRTLSYADKDNDLVSFSLKGPGNLKITSLNSAVTVDVLQTDADNTTLLGSVTKRKGGNGKTTLSLLRLRGATFNADESKFEGDIRSDV